MRTENIPMNRKRVIEYSLVADGYLFASHRDRCLYLGKSVRERPHWLEANPGRFRPLEDVERESAQLRAPGESKNNVGAALAELNGQTSSHDVAKDGDDENDVALVDTLGGDCSPSHEPTSLPAPAPEIIKNETMTLEPLRRAKVAMSEAEGPRTETTPLGAMGRKRGRSGGRQIKKQKQPEEVAKASRMLSPQRMRIVLDSLRERPILSYAASKAGIHRRTLEYWIKRSAADDPGYDIEWQGEIRRFHEHCQIAIEETHDKLLEAAWDIAMGADLKDENGRHVPEASWKQKGKMLRFLLEWGRPETYGKHRKIDVPHNSGVLVVGGIRHDIPNKVNKGTAASVQARKWKAGWRMIQKAKA
jgi:hypothetical protein